MTRLLPYLLVTLMLGGCTAIPINIPLADSGVTADAGPISMQDGGSTDLAAISDSGMPFSDGGFTDAGPTPTDGLTDATGESIPDGALEAGTLEAGVLEAGNQDAALSDLPGID